MGFGVQQLTQEGRNAVADLATRYQLTPAAVEHMLVAVNNGAGAMAQFNCPELGGSGQWMRGGMTMVGDMFNHNLKATVDNLCNELSNLLASTSVFVAPAAGGISGSGHWWPAGLGNPISSGSQNNSRYAVFADRLAVDRGGKVTVYDTSGHQIGGVSQQQGGSNSMTFSSQLGTVSVDSLPVVAMAGESESAKPAEPARAESGAESENESAAESGTESGTDLKADSGAEPETASITVSETESPAPAEFESAQNQSAQPTVNVTASEATSHASSPAAASNPSGNLSNTTAGPASGASSGAASGTEALALIEKLAQLHGAGILDDEEFSAKKRELLARI